jgi:hypothetical protein
MPQSTVHSPLDRLLAIAVVLLATVALVIVAATLPELPPVVATHFGLTGAANGWMSHRSYATLIIAFTIGFPLAIWAAVAFVPRRFPRLAKIPNRDAWLAPPQREGTLARLDTYGRIDALAGVLLAAGLHALVIAKNVPSTGATVLGGAILLLAVAVVVLLVAAIAMKRAFRRPP